MSLRIDKPFVDLSGDALSRVKGQLGVYELADVGGVTQYIGRADARTLFGLRGELEAYIDQGYRFRFEVTTAYHTRYRELLMNYIAEHGAYPPKNKPLPRLGRLSPA